MGKKTRENNRIKYTEELQQLIAQNKSDFILDDITDYQKRITRKSDGIKIDFYVTSRKYHIPSIDERGMCDVDEILLLFNKL